MTISPRKMCTYTGIVKYNDIPFISSKSDIAILYIALLYSRSASALNGKLTCPPSLGATWGPVESRGQSGGPPEDWTRRGSPAPASSGPCSQEDPQYKNSAKFPIFVREFFLAWTLETIIRNRRVPNFADCISESPVLTPWKTMGCWEAGRMDDPQNLDRELKLAFTSGGLLIQKIFINFSSSKEKGNIPISYFLVLLTNSDGTTTVPEHNEKIILYIFLNFM